MKRVFIFLVLVLAILGILVMLSPGPEQSSVPEPDWRPPVLRVSFIDVVSMWVGGNH